MIYHTFLFFVFLFSLFISLSILLCKKFFSLFRNFSGTDIFLSFMILLFVSIILLYKKFKSVAIIVLSCNLTIGRMFGGSTGKYFIVIQLGLIRFCMKLFISLSLLLYNFVFLLYFSISFFVFFLLFIFNLFSYLGVFDNRFTIEQIILFLF